MLALKFLVSAGGHAQCSIFQAGLFLGSFIKGRLRAGLKRITMILAICRCGGLSDRMNHSGISSGHPSSKLGIQSSILAISKFVGGAPTFKQGSFWAHCAKYLRFIKFQRVCWLLADLSLNRSRWHQWFWYHQTGL